MQNIFALADLRAILKAVGLLNKEHVALVLGGFHDLWTGSPVLDIDSETLIRLWTDRTVELVLVAVMASNLVLLMDLRVGRSVSSPESSEAARIHLLL